MRLGNLAHPSQPAVFSAAVQCARRDAERTSDVPVGVREPAVSDPGQWILRVVGESRRASPPCGSIGRDERPFAFAGLYGHESAAIITTDANSLHAPDTRSDCRWSCRRTSMRRGWIAAWT